ncbi:MAG: DedA family protein [Alphaproteobacteria bacterium]|nr:DedA family protein [Alphaproteobacteria bacterium]
MLQKLYAATMRLAASPRAPTALTAVSFAESSFFPVPPDLLLIPMCLARRERAFFYAGLCTLASVAGAFLGYGIGYFFYEAIGRPLLEFYNFMEAFGIFQQRYQAWGIWIVAGAGFTPFPYKVITIASGVVGMDPLPFLLASLVSRGVRFYMEAGLLWYFGSSIRGFVEKHLAPLSMGLFLVAIGLVVLLKYVL